jgi:predicted methyltransferase MtxX (methanogen marker protein 4)
VAIAEWIRLWEERVLRQTDAKLQGGRPEGGVRAAARALEVKEPEARRSIKIAALPQETKQAAVEAGLDDNQSALLKVAAKPPEEQVEEVKAVAAAKERKAEHKLDSRIIDAAIEGMCAAAKVEEDCSLELANMLNAYIPAALHPRVISLLAEAKPKAVIVALRGQSQKKETSDDIVQAKADKYFHDQTARLKANGEA